jgi:hypothetical protein
MKQRDSLLLTTIYRFNLKALLRICSALTICAAMMSPTARRGSFKLESDPCSVESNEVEATTTTSGLTSTASVSLPGDNKLIEKWEMKGIFRAKYGFEKRLYNSKTLIQQTEHL